LIREEILEGERKEGPVEGKVVVKSVERLRRKEKPKCRFSGSSEKRFGRTRGHQDLDRRRHSAEKQQRAEKRGCSSQVT